MTAIRVQIIRWVDDHQPGFVECRFTDRSGRDWMIIEKLPIVSDAQLDQNSSYPQQGSIPCTVVSRIRDQSGREVAEVDIAAPVFVEAVDGETLFQVFVDDLIKA
ncbi:hypothetical protein [Inquilinus sp. CA228]|uniref:hypothetical protein n=1 Tax=Inquilinus sp. CA228 TaxID=3455609 RepID=UPI003F8D8DA5